MPGETWRASTRREREDRLTSQFGKGSVGNMLTCKAQLADLDGHKLNRGSGVSTRCIREARRRRHDIVIQQVLARTLATYPVR